jgi:hypothetical protein
MNADEHATVLRVKWNIICPKNCVCKDVSLWRLDEKIKELDRKISILAQREQARALQTAKTLLQLYNQARLEKLQLKHKT